MNKTIATILIAGAVGAGGMSLGNQSIDTKGVEHVQVCVNIKEDNYHDRICYSPEAWEQKTEEEINTEKTRRFENWKKTVEEASKLDGENNEIF